MGVTIVLAFMWFKLNHLFRPSYSRSSRLRWSARMTGI